MNSSLSAHPRRLFDAQFDYSQRRGSVANEAERAIILRLVDGVPQQYLLLMSTGWRAAISDCDRSNTMVKLWYEAVERMVKNEDLMSQFKLKADFYREFWNGLPVLERLRYSRNDWISVQLVECFRKNTELAQEYDGASDGLPVSQELCSKYAEFERRYIRENKYSKATQQTYFELTQPKAAESLRQLAAGMLAREIDERARTVESAVKRNLQTAFQYAEETRYRRMQRHSAVIHAKGQTPLVWPWEKNHPAATKAGDDEMDIDVSPDLNKDNGATRE